MNVLQLLRDNKSTLDIHQILFESYLIITVFAGAFFSFINIINRRPAVNILTGFTVSLISALLCSIVKRYKCFEIIRPLYMALLTIIYIPYGYWSSPGSSSAILYLALLVVFMTTIVAVKPWEYIFPILGVGLSVIMLQTEIWFPDHYEVYFDDVTRIRDITLNYLIVVMTVFLTTVYVIRQYHKYNRRLYLNSITDGLTGLYNRRFFNDYLAEEYNRAVRNGEIFSMVFMDMNNFKCINDVYGHSIGDEVLIEFADILMANIRNHDIPARYGGDEFVVILPRTEKKEALAHVNRLMKLFDQCTKKYKDVGLSVGHGIEDSKEKQLQDIIKMADEALYRRKSSQKSASVHS